MPPLWLLGASIFVFSTSSHIRIPRRAYLRCGDGTNLFDWSLHWGMTWLGCPASQAEKNWILTIHCNFFVKNIWGGNVYWEKAWLVRLEYEDERGGKVHCHKWEKPLKFLPFFLRYYSYYLVLIPHWKVDFLKFCIISILRQACCSTSTHNLCDP